MKRTDITKKITHARVSFLFSLQLKMYLNVEEGNHIVKFLYYKLFTWDPNVLRTDFDSNLYLCERIFTLLPIEIIQHLVTTGLLAPYAAGSLVMIGLLIISLKRQVMSASPAKFGIIFFHCKTLTELVRRRSRTNFEEVKWTVDFIVTLGQLSVNTLICKTAVWLCIILQEFCKIFSIWPLCNKICK